MKALAKILALVGAFGGAADVRACEVALVVALDVSRSVDKFEYLQMRDGIAKAFLHRDVIELISFMPGGIQATITQWGGEGQQRQAVGWTRLTDHSSILRFVERFVARERGFWMADTAIAEALVHANLTLSTVPKACRRRVIDISGDGIANAGPDVPPIARAITDKGVTINELVIAGAKPDPVSYFLHGVIGGPGAFVEIAGSYGDYSNAMKRKLMRELTPALAEIDQAPFPASPSDPISDTSPRGLW